MSKEGPESKKGRNQKNLESKRQNMKMTERSKMQEFARWYFSFDPKDVWNWILLALAIILFWWGIETILHSFKI